MHSNRDMLRAKATSLLLRLSVPTMYLQNLSEVFISYLNWKEEEATFVFINKSPWLLDDRNFLTLTLHSQIDVTILLLFTCHSCCNFIYVKKQTNKDTFCCNIFTWILKNLQKYTYLFSFCNATFTLKASHSTRCFRLVHL